MKFKLEQFLKSRKIPCIYPINGSVPLLRIKRIVLIFKDTYGQHLNRYSRKSMSKVTLQVISNSDRGNSIDLELRFSNGWIHPMNFLKSDTPQTIAYKLLALSNAVLHNENLDAPGLPDDSNYVRG